MTAAVGLFAGCKKSSSSEGQSAATSPGLAEKIVFKGEQRLELKPKDDGAKLVGEGDREIARYNAKDGGYKIKDASDAVLGYVKGEGRKIKIEGPNKEPLYYLVRQDDGDYKLEDGHEALLYKVKVKPDGRKIEDASGTKIGEVKVKDDHTELRDASDGDRYKTREAVSPDAVACLGFDKVALPLRVGLLLRLETGKNK